MKCMYSGGDIKKYLDDCFIRYDGVPYYASVDGTRVHLVDLETKTTVKIVGGDDPLLDISSIRPNWVNINRDFCVFIKRFPYRRWKQGLCISNIMIKELRPSKSSSNHVDKNDLLTKAFKDSLLGKYPSYEEAFKSITSKERISVAISDQIAMERDAGTIRFYFNDYVVGVMELPSKVVLVKKDNYSWIAILELSKIKGLEIKEV